MCSSVLTYRKCTNRDMKYFEWEGWEKSSSFLDVLFYKTIKA